MWMNHIKCKRITGAQLGGEGGGLPYPFLKIKKRCPDFGKKCPDYIHP